jgi:hypothetical protein
VLLFIFGPPRVIELNIEWYGLISIFGNIIPNLRFVNFYFTSLSRYSPTDINACAGNDPGEQASYEMQIPDVSNDIRLDPKPTLNIRRLLFAAIFENPGRRFFPSSHGI